MDTNKQDFLYIFILKYVKNVKMTANLLEQHGKSIILQEILLFYVIFSCTVCQIFPVFLQYYQWLFFVLKTVIWNQNVESKHMVLYNTKHLPHFHWIFNTMMLLNWICFSLNWPAHRSLRHGKSYSRSLLICFLFCLSFFFQLMFFTSHTSKQLNPMACTEQLQNGVSAV